MNCSICKRNKINEFGINSHNAQPVTDGRCCDTCNLMVVVPRRISDMKQMEELI